LLVLPLIVKPAFAALAARRRGAADSGAGLPGVHLLVSTAFFRTGAGRGIFGLLAAI